ncbi:MAG: response regulator, partial [Verrucomicrobiaceae bacterium]|nr:response regulator [Verrucomicrobiaceae bacterium]
EGIRDSVEAVLEISGIHCVKASDAEEALGILTQCPLDLVLLDSNLPGANGEELAQQLRDEGNNIPIIGVSAEDRRATMFTAGVTAFLDKPFNPNDLLATIDRLLESMKSLAG